MRLPVSALTHLISIRAVGVSVLYCEPWIKHLPLYVSSCEEILVVPQLSNKLGKIHNVEEVFKQIHQIGHVLLDVMGI